MSFKSGMRPMAIVTMFFFLGLCLGDFAVAASEKSPGGASQFERGDGAPGVKEVTKPVSGGAVVKAKKKIPWLLGGAGVVVVGLLVYFLLLKTKKPTLTVTVGAGATGTPAAGSYSYAKGTAVSYSYTLAGSGYANLAVLLDGTAVSSSGTITMNGDHSLTIGTATNPVYYTDGVLMVNGVRYDMIAISGGEFQMGSNSALAYSDEKPVHTVRLSRGYWLGRTEVTQGLWQVVLGENPSNFKSGSDYPVEMISWDNCQAFITRLNQLLGSTVFRLPTEAEWEYAARAGTTGDYYGTADAIGWYDENSGGATHPVARKQANAWGLYDMSGNVGEWCQDWFGSYQGGYQTDPAGPSSGQYRVFRGGSWSSVVRNVRSVTRSRIEPNNATPIKGMRLAASSSGG